MRTAQEMVDFCVKKNFNGGEKAGKILKHFSLIENVLKPDEEVLTAFTVAGVNSRGGKRVTDGITAVAFTTERCIYAKMLLLGAQTVKIIPCENISDVQMGQNAFVLGTIKIDFLTEEATFAMAKSYVQPVYDEIAPIFEKYRKAEAENSVGGTVAMQNSAADELKKFKDLLDSGVITQEEFDAKKKQLLGL